MTGEPDLRGFDDSVDVQIEAVPHPVVRRRLHRLAEPALLAAAISAVVVAAHFTREVAPPQPTPASAPSTAPAFAAPGGRPVVLAYRNAGRCEHAEIRLDGALLERRLIGATKSFLIVQVPHSTAAGAHRLDLHGTTAIGSTTFFVAPTEH